LTGSIRIRASDREAAKQAGTDREADTTPMVMMTAIVPTVRPRIRTRRRYCRRSNQRKDSGCNHSQSYRFHFCYLTSVIAHAGLMGGNVLSSFTNLGDWSVSKDISPRARGGPQEPFHMSGTAAASINVKGRALPSSQ
jgi:hypothetical protein